MTNRTNLPECSECGETQYCLAGCKGKEEMPRSQAPTLSEDELGLPMNHGDHPDCGLRYETNEMTMAAFCPCCAKSFHTCLEGWSRGTIIRYTLKHLYSIGMITAPINGRIVGSTGRFPIVQWSNGNTAAVSPGAIEKVKTK